MATLIKQNGRYYLQFYQRDRSPAQKKIALKTTRKRPGRQKQRELEDAYIEGIFDPWNDDPFNYVEPDRESPTIQEALDRFLERKREDGRAKSTVRTYEEVVGIFSREIGEDTPLDAIGGQDLREFVRDPALAQATQHKRYGHLRTFFRWCIKESLLGTSPLEAIAKPKKPSKLPKAIAEEELEQVCQAVQTDYEEKRAKNQVREGQNVWRIPLFWFAFYTGMRGSELGRLRWRHIDYDRQLIYIYKQKNGKEQTIPLNRKAKVILEDLEEETPVDYVFRAPNFEGEERESRYFRERASRAFRKARRRAGIERKLSFHSSRHGFCTRLAEAGKPLQVIKKAARHADVETSMIYVHMANEHLKAELDDVF
jgi:integrase